MNLVSNTPEPVLKNGFEIFKLLGEYKTFSLNLITEIVEELVFPLSSRKHKLKDIGERNNGIRSPSGTYWV